MSEYPSPKNKCLKFDLTPIIICKSLSKIKLVDSELTNESPEIKSAGFARRNSSNLSPGKKSFLARAREKHRKNTQVPYVVNENKDDYTNNQRCLTYNNEEFFTDTYQLRIRIDSPCQNDGDHDIIEFIDNY